MTKIQEINVKDTIIRTINVNGVDYICITDIARQKNQLEPKDVVKNWMRLKNTIEYLGMWEMLNNPYFNGVEFDPLLREAGNNAFTQPTDMSFQYGKPQCDISQRWPFTARTPAKTK